MRPGDAGPSAFSSFDEEEVRAFPRGKASIPRQVSCSGSVKFVHAGLLLGEEGGGIP